jgi:hypothetical protein
MKKCFSTETHTKPTAPCEVTKVFLFIRNLTSSHITTTFLFGAMAVACHISTEEDVFLCFKWCWNISWITVNQANLNCNHQISTILKGNVACRSNLLRWQLLVLLEASWCFYLIQNGKFREILASNHSKLFLFYLPLSLHPGQKIETSNPYPGKKTGTLNLFHGT